MTSPSLTVPELFEEQVEKTPEAIAVVYEDQQLTYAELNARANRLGHHLIGMGVGPEDVVGLAVPRSVEMVIALLGILKAGAAYLPLDPDYPEERLRFMVEDAAPVVLLTTSEVAWRLPKNRPCAVVDSLEIRTVLAEDPARDLIYTGRRRSLGLQSAVYVMYTSGSTGTPKGSVITHGSVVRLVLNAGYVNFVTEDRVAQVANAAFDAVTFEIWGPLLNGATAIIIDKQIVLNPVAFKKMLHSERVTIIFLTTALFNQMAREAKGSFSEMRYVLFGGEKVDPQWPRSVLDEGAPERLLHVYGPTEATTFSTWFQIREVGRGAGTIPIGRPIAATRAYVLDANLELAPIGGTGELYIAGDGLARGYLKRGGLTAERFVADPYGLRGKRMYRTGDLARWREDGNLEFLGRADNQVKIRGFRVELGEIETVLRRHPEVQDVVVTAQEDGDEKRLVGYVICAQSQNEQEQAKVSHIEEWRQLYDSTYRRGRGLSGDFNIAGWESSYTGEPIPAEEMQIWVEETVARLRELKPRRVLEIGCGTGLLLTRLASQCESYIGLDFSQEALGQLSEYLFGRSEFSHVKLLRGLAHELSFIDDDSVDLVILNSVVQYFPDMDYLAAVLRDAVRVTDCRGNVFVGDVRSLPLLEAYHASVQLHRASDDTTVAELRRQIEQARRKEEELLVDPEFFNELGRRWAKVGHIEAALKAGAYNNELSRFRYDAVISLGEKAEPSTPEWRVVWDGEGRWRENVRQIFNEDPSASVGLERMRDRRVAGAVETVRLLASPGSELRSVAQLRSACANISGEDPDAVIRLARKLGVKTSWRICGASGIYDVEFNPRLRNTDGLNEMPQESYRPYGNAPARSLKHRDLGRFFRQYLKTKLPDYMVPVAIVVLEKLPLTANGKLDRKALPAPELVSTVAYRAPGTPEEEILCTLFAEVLGLERVGLDDNFFELGGHSLMATRLVSHIRATLGVELAIRTLFEAGSVGELRPHLRSKSKERVALTRRERPKRLPLSYAQERLWFLDRLQGRSTEYNMPLALRLRGELDREALEKAINAIVERHESLRTRFEEEDGEPEQVIEPEWNIAVGFEDLRGLSEEKQQERVEEELRREGSQAFDLKQGPVLRVKLLKLGEREHVLLRTMHHIVSDGWSEGVFNREFEVLYEAFQQGRENPLKALEVQYADFAMWQREWLEGEALSEGLKYWKGQLAGIPERLELPTDRARPAAQTFGAEVCQVELSAEQVGKLKRLSRENQATLYMTLLGAFGVLLSRYSGQEDIVVGSPIANRQEAQLEEMIGFFVNSLVMRVVVKGGMSFRELLSQVRRTALEAYQHQDVPFERLVEELAPERNLNRTPVFQVMFALQNAPMDAQQLAGLEVEEVANDAPGARFDLEVHAFEEGERVRLYWVYNRDLFDQWRMDQMARHYVRVLEAVVANADQAIAGIDLLGFEERRRILEEWNDTAQAITDRTLPELFEEQVEKTPEAIAVVYEDQQLTYAELNARANRLGHHLIGMGVGPEDVVGLAVPRSVEMVIALLGILKAGAAYLPLDPDYPEERLRFMVEDAAPVVLLTTSEVARQLPGICPEMILDEPAQLKALDRKAASNPDNSVRARPLTPQNPAYVIYTSGSTGQPKGIVMQGAALVNLAEYGTTFVGRLGSRVAQFTTISFDVSLQEIFAALSAARTLCIPPNGVRNDAAKLAGWLSTHGVSSLFAPVSIIESLCETALEQRNEIASLEGAFQAGEVLRPSDLLRRFFARAKHLRFYNHYGPSETHVATAYELPQNSLHWPVSIPIGRPIWNMQIYVLDGNLEVVPIGAAGELYIAGDGLARGYLKRAGLTAERFVANPFGTLGTRMYRTGDLARWKEDGNLEFLGRADNQVKIRGFRVELGEIEAVLRELEGVQDAVVVAQEDRSGEKRLAGYVIPVAGQRIDGNTLRQQLRRKLPDYMVPVAIVVLDKLPLTANGKLDRKALPAPELVSTVAYRAPGTPEEEILCTLFAEVLGLERVGLDDNFLDLGGHSLMATRLVSRVRRALGVEMSVRMLFQRRSVGELTTAVQASLFSITNNQNKVTAAASGSFEEEEI